MSTEEFVPTRDARTLERFWAKVDLGGVCWEWTGARNREYGSFGLVLPPDGRGKTVLAHRFAYEALVGPISARLELDHLCRNPPCVNPDHLEPVTHAENMARSPRQGIGLPKGLATQRARTRCGQQHDFDDANTGYRPDGSRYCRTCSRERMRARRKEFSVR